MTTWLPRMCRCGHIGKEHPGPDGGGACTRDELRLHGVPTQPEPLVIPPDAPVAGSPLCGARYLIEPGAWACCVLHDGHDGQHRSGRYEW